MPEKSFKFRWRVNAFEARLRMEISRRWNKRATTWEAGIVVALRRCPSTLCLSRSLDSVRWTWLVCEKTAGTRRVGPDQSSSLMRQTSLYEWVVHAASCWLVLVHAYLQVRAHVVRSWGTFVSYRNQPRHIPCLGYLGTRCFVRSSLLVLVTPLARSGDRVCVPTVGQTWFSTVSNFRGNAYTTRVYRARSLDRWWFFDSWFVFRIFPVAFSVSGVHRMYRMWSTMRSPLTSPGNCWLIGPRAAIV